MAIPELDGLFRIDLANRHDGIPDEDCWFGCPMWDIPETMQAAVRNAPPNIKAMTFRPSNPEVDDQTRKACREKNIMVVWARPPEFVRYLDG